MYNESGFGRGGAPYEYVIGQKQTATVRMKKLLLILLDVVWVVGLVAFGAAVRLAVYLLAFIPLSVWILTFFTWRYTQIAYEYSFWGGEWKVTRLYGERTRKPMAELRIRDLKLVCPCTSVTKAQIAAFEAERELFAASSPDALGLSAALWLDEQGRRTVLYFEPNEKAWEILRYYNPDPVSEEPLQAN